MDYIAIDTETGGTQPGRHALLSIAAYPSWDLQNPFIVYLFPDDHYVVEAEAAAINGYTLELWKERGAKWIFEGMAMLCDWLKARFKERHRAVMLAHNAGFDRMFLDEAARFTGMRMPIRHVWRCSMDKLGCLMDRGLIAEGKANLDRLGALSGQWPEGGRPAIHEAGEDALACLIGYQWLLQKEKTEVDTLRQLYTDSIRDRRHLENGLYLSLSSLKADPLNCPGLKEKLLEIQAHLGTRRDGLSLIVGERFRQIYEKGWKPEHDDKHSIGELCSAAGAYLFAGDCLANAAAYNPKYVCTSESLTEEILEGSANPVAWPWEADGLKISEDPVLNLVKAGALIAAEIDRLLRLKGKEGQADG